jgi:REP element-mobilizing transposase RayT
MCASDRFPKRPPRIVLFREIRAFYFLTITTHRRRPLLENKKVHDAFIQFATRGHREHGVATGRYVIMPDHLHLFVCLPDTGILLVQWAGGLKRHLGTIVSTECGAGPVWQRGFFDHVIRNHESYSEKWEYVRQNPVRKGLCTKPEEWPWQGEVVPIRV